MRKRPPVLIGTLLLLLGCSGDGPTGSMFATLSITTASLPDVIPTLTYTTTVAATGGDGAYTWSISAGSLPGDMQIGSSSGVVAGRAIADGTYNFTLRVSSGDGQVATLPMSLTVEPRCKDMAPSEVITFADANLAAQVRAALTLGPSDDITCGAALSLTILYASSANIVSLVGVQHLTGLHELHLRDNQITDLSAVTGLSDLQILVIGVNQINDISLLSELTTTLWDLDVGGNPINDIGSLSNLTGMTKLYVNATPVSDISPLVGLTLLGDVDLADNPNLMDIQALLDNTGLGSGDMVELTNTPVSCSDIDLLIAKGVTVISDCP